MDKPILLKCGCVATSILTRKAGVKIDPPVPSCSIHCCTDPAQEQPNLIGRKAHCADCRSEKDSDYNLPFFEYRGPESKWAKEMCTCGFYKSAHKKENTNLGLCDNFTSRGTDFDRFYCGCHGWS